MASMEKQGTHFWHMVIQTPGADGRTQVTSCQGTTTPKRGVTRLDLFNEVRELVRSNHPHTEHGAVIAFDVHPNKL